MTSTKELNFTIISVMTTRVSHQHTRMVPHGQGQGGIATGDASGRCNRFASGVAGEGGEAMVR